LNRIKGVSISNWWEALLEKVLGERGREKEDRKNGMKGDSKRVGKKKE
jgi:hypothetical protein